MTITKPARPAAMDAAGTAQLDLHTDTEYILRARDRADLKWLLSRKDPAAQKLSPYVVGLLRYKVENARKAAAQGTDQLVIPLKRITYVLNDEAARVGILTMCIAARPGHIPVGSVLGATLIGMERFQKAPMLTEDGTLRTLCVLKVETVDYGSDGA